MNTFAPGNGSSFLTKCKNCKEKYEMMKKMLPSCGICGFFRIDNFNGLDGYILDKLCCNCDISFDNMKFKHLSKTSNAARAAKPRLPKSSQPSRITSNIEVTSCSICGQTIQNWAEHSNILTKSILASSEDQNLIDWLPLLHSNQSMIFPLKSFETISDSNVFQTIQKLASQSKKQWALFTFKPEAKKEDEIFVVVFGTELECARIKGGCGLRMLPRHSYQPRIDIDKTLELSQEEWTHYFMFHPSADMHDILNHWRHATVLDLGEDMSVPDDFSPQEVATGQWWRHLVAGGAAGAVSRTCTAPLDRLKVFLQVGKPGGTMFGGVQECLMYMYKEGGFKSLWRGNGINALKIAPESALKFAAFDQAKRFIKTNCGDPTRELQIYERLVAGSFAGVCSQTSIYPMEVVKTRLALRKSGQFSGIADAFAKIYRAEGLRAFYRGYAPNVMGIIPYAGIDLAVYETLKHRFSPKGKNVSVWTITACGAIAPSCAMVTVYPLALIRTRLQAQVPSQVNRNTPTTARAMFRDIWFREGLRGLYRGLAPNFLKVIPATITSYLVYENVRPLLGVEMS